jgi:uncharacterized protein (DUF697 family)
MAKRKETNPFEFESHDTLPDADSAAFPVDSTAFPVDAETSMDEETSVPVPVFEPVQDTKREIQPFDLITRARAEEIIKNRSLLAAGLGIVPVPVFNCVSVMAVQIAMVQSITRLYNVEVKKSWIKNIIASVLGGLATTGLSGAAARSLGAAPLVGTSLAVLSAPALNGLTTYAIGYMFVRYFESPDGFLKTNVKALGGWFKEGFKEGREKLGGAIAGKVQAA